MMSEDIGTHGRDETFKNNQGTIIYRKIWPLKDGQQPRATILLCHGFAEHSMRYQKFAAFLNSNDFTVFSHDHIGHGRSEGERAMVQSFDQYVDDVLQHVQMIKEEHPHSPLFLIGHSMGGLIAAKAGLRMTPGKFQGVVFIAAAFSYDTAEATPCKIEIAKVLSQLIPSFPMAKLKLETLSRDNALVKDYVQDPLVYHGSMKARWLVHTLSAITSFQSESTKITFPCLILHGDKDQLVPADGASIVYKAAASTDKALKVYTGFYHQLHYEPAEDGEMVRRDIAEWLLARCAKW